MTAPPGDGHGQVVGVRCWPRPMGGDKKQPEENAPSPDQEEAEELQRILQSDDIAPVDYASYGRSVAHIILRGVIAYWRKN
jgi:hypothetical protein